jgi:hypothetical protein
MNTHFFSGGLDLRARSSRFEYTHFLSGGQDLRARPSEFKDTFVVDQADPVTMSRPPGS